VVGATSSDGFLVMGAICCLCLNLFSLSHSNYFQTSCRFCLPRPNGSYDIQETTGGASETASRYPSRFGPERIYAFMSWL